MSFIGSRPFIVSAVVGLLIGATILAAPSVAPGLFDSLSGACSVPGGDAIQPHRLEDGSNFREEHYRGLAPLTLDVCVAVGSITIRSSADSFVAVEVVIRGGNGGHDVVDDTAFTITQDMNTLAIRQTSVGRGGAWFGSSAAIADVTILVPETAAIAYDVRLDVGDVDATGMSGMGGQSWNVDVGELQLEYRQLSDALSASVDVGSVRITVPAGQPLSLDAQTDVGEITVDVDGFSTTSRTSDPPSQSVKGTTPGAPKSTVTLRVDVGDVTLRDS